MQKTPGPARVRRPLSQRRVECVARSRRPGRARALAGSASRRIKACAFSRARLRGREEERKRGGGGRARSAGGACARAASSSPHGSFPRPATTAGRTGAHHTCAVWRAACVPPPHAPAPPPRAPLVSRAPRPKKQTAVLLREKCHSTCTSPVRRHASAVPPPRTARTEIQPRETDRARHAARA